MSHLMRKPVFGSFWLGNTQNQPAQLQMLATVFKSQIYHKNPKNSDIQKIAVTILNLEQNRFTTDKLAQKTE